MLALILACGWIEPVEYFPEAGSGTPLPQRPPLDAPQVPDPARALLDDPSPETARAFLAWERAQRDRLRAALEALDETRAEEDPPAAPPRSRALGDLLDRFRPPQRTQRARR